MIDTSEYVLGEQAFLKGLSPAHLMAIAECAHPVTFASGEYVFHEGDPANHFYILTYGQVSLELYVPGRGSHVIQTVEKDEVLGWSWLFPPYRWHFDGRALTVVRAIDFNGMCLRAKCDADHDLGYDLMQRFAQTMMSRLQATRLQLLDVYGG
ncbi:MAG TPA: cyclic nucleotide-binding domain-containing protein [Chloroflexia bacterium]|jgi:CRP-like cAMP-binding protein|nr:cyclic nucleotide-binding domain-containing protein [Chloroflexia bacterium]